MQPVYIVLDHATLYLDLEGAYFRTMFNDGTCVEARPNGDEEATLFWLHDFLHSVLAEATHSAPSPTLWAVAHPGAPDNISTDAQWAEEGRVCQMQIEGARGMLRTLERVGD